jgi:CsoR family transcriptional regulator, copper-sensing transcriptional repressor
MDQTISIGHESCDCDERSTARSLKLKADLSIRLNRVEGQVRGIRSMIERDVYCDDVINQIFAARSALDAVGKLLLKNHIQGCVVEKIKMGDPEIVDELIVTISKMI